MNLYQNSKEEKDALRKSMAKKRNSLAPPYMQSASERVCSYIIQESKYIRCKDLLVYSSFGSELNTRPLVDRAFKDGKNVYFPKVEGDDMTFYKVQDLRDLKSGFSGIMEPFGYSGKISDFNEAICVIPGLVFGKNGYRIGYGKGYYDRFLAKYPNIYKIGVCFDSQLVEYAPFEEFDIRLDEVISESYIFAQNGKGEARWS